VRSVLPALPAKESAHGYELKQALENTFGSACPSRHIGRIHVTLGRLEKDGLVRSEDVTQSNRPSERVHELTPAGREAVAEWLDTPGDGPRPSTGSTPHCH
jgi:DNA-binding PadR family transcriptional regulator